MYAIMKTGGKQYKVAPNDTLEVEKVAGEAGATVEFEALLVGSNDGKVETKPTAKVKATIVAQVRDKKIVVYKYKAKKNQRRKQGHRQPHTKIKIVSVN